VRARSTIRNPIRAGAFALTLLLALAGCGGADEPHATVDAPGAADGHAVVLLYHHVSGETPASTSVSPETFAAHLDYLAEQDYTVLPVSRLVTALVEDEPLPARAVAITFDDAYRSVLTEAAPRLARYGFPYAVFVSTDYVDQRLDGYLGWDELRALERSGAEIGNHSQTHRHWVHRPPDESTTAWRARIRADIEAAQARLQAELADPLPVLAYPYGEFTPELTALARQLGYVAFGQQSGPAGHASDLQALPRFPMAASYAALPGFAEKLRTRPFAVQVLADDGPVLAPDAGPPTLRLRLEAPGARLHALACFVGGQPAPELDWLDADRGLLTVTPERPLPVGRSKITCTAPARDAAGIFYWYSHLYMTPPAPGRWYAD
jgi:peptidoglycan/xylan/chitin deacetylase (PgdA/CDA1 family)